MNVTLNCPIIWLCGRPGAGKSTIAKVVASELQGKSIRCDVIDSDFYRRHLLMPNDFSEQSNAENALRYGRIAELLAKNDILPIVSAVAWNPEIVAAFKKEFPHSLVVYLHCPLEICVARDPQGLYRRTGDEVQRIYREPREYDLTVDTGVMPLARCAQVILTRIIEMVPFTMRNIS